MPKPSPLTVFIAACCIGMAGIVCTTILMVQKDATDRAYNPGGLETVNSTVWRDTVTGCEYLAIHSVLTPRIAADGRTHMGCGTVGNPTGEKQ